MKQKILLMSLCALSMYVSGCSDSGPDADTGVHGLVPVSFSLSFSGMRGPETRSLAPGYSFADGSSVSVLKCYLYNTADEGPSVPSKVVDIAVKTVDGRPCGDFTVMLPKGQSYDAVFLGTSIPQDNPYSKLYYSQTDRTLSFNYDDVYANDEELDCFWGVCTSVTAENASVVDVTLDRPFAQLNIGTQDYEAYVKSKPVSGIAVSVDGVYRKMRLMDGSLESPSSSVTFKASPVPGGQTFPVDGFSYLSMNYLLVDQRALVDVSLTIRHSDSSSRDVSLGDVAVERNYQTNVYGSSILSGN